MDIQVTQDHIDRGIPGSCENCALAIALNEKIPQQQGPGKVGAIVWSGIADFMVNEPGNGNVRRQYHLTQDTKEWVKLFDKDPTLVKPITVRLETNEDGSHSMALA